MLNIPSNIRNIIGSRPFEIDTIGMSSSQVICFEDMVLKIDNQNDEADLEVKLMTWLADKLPVPKILCLEKENDKSFLLMSRVEGLMSCDENIIENPNLLVKILAEGLNMLWHVDISNCPYSNSLERKLELAEYNIRNNICDLDNVEPETFGKNGFKNPDELLKWLKENKPSEDLVFSHGDFCLPNVFINDNKISGFIDLGRSGIADRYQDIALCYRSLSHNYSGTYGGKVYKDFDPNILFEELKIGPDWEKIKYYILLDELF